MKTPGLDHDPVFTDTLDDIQTGGAFYADSPECERRDLLILLSRRQWHSHHSKDLPPVEETNIMAARLRDGMTLWLSSATPVRPVEHEAREIVRDDE